MISKLVNAEHAVVAINLLQAGRVQDIVLDQLAKLAAYPYGCAEQTASKVSANVAVVKYASSQLMERVPDDRSKTSNDD